MLDIFLEISKKNTVFISVFIGTLAYIVLESLSRIKKGFIKEVLTLLIKTALVAYYIIPIFIEIFHIDSYLQIRAIYAFSSFYIQKDIIKIVIKKTYKILDLDD